MQLQHIEFLTEKGHSGRRLTLNFLYDPSHLVQQLRVD